MCKSEYFILSLLVAVSFATDSWGEIAQKPRSWKYLVVRKIKKDDLLLNKQESHIDRALVYFYAQQPVC